MSELNEMVQQAAAQSPLQLAWEPALTRHTGGEILRLGKYPVGDWQVDATLTNGAKANYAVSCRLPGVRAEVGHCESSDKARALLEKVVKSWVKHAGLAFTTVETPVSGAMA